MKYTDVAVDVVDVLFAPSMSILLPAKACKTLAFSAV